jgi:Asp-tRNA(Asn)/Glu-tRNA(Gln) amidotransferase A subunit family amidase
MTTLTDMTVRQALAALDKGEISTRELTSACLERINRLEPRLHAFLTLIPEQAMHAAEAADRKRQSARKSGASLPPLLGLPSRMCWRSKAYAAPPDRKSSKTSSRLIPPLPSSA